MPTALQRRMIPLLLDYLYDKKNVPVHYKSGLIEQLLHHLDSEDGNVSIDLAAWLSIFKRIRQIDIRKRSNLTKSIALHENHTKR